MSFMELQGLMDAIRRDNQIIAEATSETRVVFINGEAVIPADSEHFHDSLHFQEAGSRVMAQRVSEALLGNLDFQAFAMWSVNRVATELQAGCKWFDPAMATRGISVLYFIE